MIILSFLYANDNEYKIQLKNFERDSTSEVYKSNFNLGENLEKKFIKIVSDYENPAIGIYSESIVPIKSIKIVVDLKSNKIFSIISQVGYTNVSAGNFNENKIFDGQISQNDKYFTYTIPYKLVLKDNSVNFYWIQGDSIVNSPYKTCSLFEPNQIFPNFKTKTIKNRNFDLSKYKGKIIVLNYWTTGCTPCKEEIPELNKLYDKYCSTIKFIAISGNCDRKAIRKFLKKNPFKYEQLQANEQMLPIFSAGVPRHVIIDKSGRVVYSKSCNRTFDELNAIIEEVIK